MNLRTSSLRVWPRSPAASSSSRTNDSGKRVPTGIVSSPNRDGRPGRTFHSPSPSPASERLWIARTDSWMNNNSHFRHCDTGLVWFCGPGVVRVVGCY